MLSVCHFYVYHWTWFSPQPLPPSPDCRPSKDVMGCREEAKFNHYSSHDCSTNAAIQERVSLKQSMFHSACVFCVLLSHQHLLKNNSARKWIFLPCCNRPRPKLQMTCFEKWKTGHLIAVSFRYNSSPRWRMRIVAENQANNYTGRGHNNSSTTHYDVIPRHRSENT